LKIAVALFLLRESLVEMDVPTRQSYVAAVVRPHERTYASGITNLTRTLSWAGASSFAGALMQNLAFSAPLIVGGSLKIGYDLLLYRGFRSIRPPEEIPTSAPSLVSENPAEQKHHDSSTERKADYAF
jgi:predicted MFS family arabinose efflux permease